MSFVDTMMDFILVFKLILVTGVMFFKFKKQDKFEESLLDFVDVAAIVVLVVVVVDDDVIVV